MFVQVERHKSTPDGEVVEFAFFRGSRDEDRVEIASLLNTKFVDSQHVERGTFNTCAHTRVFSFTFKGQQQFLGVLVRPNY